jgi:glucose/mannose-6-phosphate isomerase
MFLNDISLFEKLDPGHMLAEIESLPDQLEKAWQSGQQLDLPDWQDIRQVVVTGMGGSAIGGDLVAAYADLKGNLPVIVHRGYDLPAWAGGPQTLVIASSHSGNTEETLSSARSALERNCRLLAVTTGGELAELIGQANAPCWQFEHEGQPRAAVGYSFGLTLSALARLGVVDDPADELAQTIALMREQRSALGAESPIAQNFAKRMAGQLMGRFVVIFGAGYLAPVARRWKTQINENAKAFAQFETLPEASHNTLAGTVHPETLGTQVMALFLQAPDLHPRDRLRLELTRQVYMLEGIGTDVINARGSFPLAQIWNSLQLGDTISYYLAMCYGVDPTPVDRLQEFKATLKTME